MSTILITGCNRGIGFELTKESSKRQHHVVVACRTLELAESTIESIIEQTGRSRKFTPIVCDLACMESIKTLCNHLKDEHIHIDLLINNAAILIDKDLSILDIEVDQLRKAFDTNFFGVFALTKSIAKRMATRNSGRIVMISSLAGQTDNLIDHMPSYRLSKSALNALTRTLACHFSGSNIEVCAIDPGWVKTDMGGLDAEKSPAEAARSILDIATDLTLNINGKLFSNGSAIEW